MGDSDKVLDDGRPNRNRSRRRTIPWVTLAIVSCTALLWYAKVSNPHIGSQLLAYLRLSRTTEPKTSPRHTSQTSCSSPLPDVFTTNPPLASHPLIKTTADAFASQLESRFAEGDIDSLAIAVVTSEGSIFEGTYGVVRANETDAEKRGKVNRDTVYRLASVSKVFTVLETLILRDRGVLQLDDPLTKFFPDFHYGPPPTASPETTRTNRHQQPPVTLRQLGSHMSGLGMIHPPGTLSNWPYSLQGAGHPPDNGNPFPTHEEVLDAVRRFPKSAEPWRMGLYSNTGLSLLGQANVIADGQRGESEAKANAHAELLERDVFGPLGMERSGFLASKYKEGELAISSVEPEAADYDFKDAMNPAGGQFSSLSDLITPLQTFLNPSHPISLLPLHTLHEWLHPLHPLFDDLTEIGMPWEIIKTPNKWNKKERTYIKWGQLAGYHTALSVNPQKGYGVVVLMTGRYPDSQDFLMRAVRAFQPVFDELLEEAAKELYEGTWVHEDSSATVRVENENGSIKVEKLVLKNVDTLGMLQGSPAGDAQPVNLFSTGRTDEFRLALGVPGFNDAADYGCLIYMLGFDVGYARGQAIDLVYWSGEGEERRMHVPAAGVTLRRVSRAVV